MESSDAAACRLHDADTEFDVVGAARFIRLDSWAPMMQLAAASVAVEEPDPGPVWSIPQTPTATVSKGRSVDPPPRGERMCLRSRMREICTSG